MTCPKCKSKIGLRHYESRTQVHLAQGATCCVCGYWLEGGALMQEQAKRQAGKRMKRR